MTYFQVLESVNGTTLLKNIVGTNEYDVLFFEVAVGFPLVQGFGVAQCLIVTGSLR